MTTLPEGYLPVLDHGYVGLVDYMGSDLSVTAAARVSYDKIPTEWNEKEERLLRFLAREGHTSPFRHAVLEFEAYTPLMVARQWWKHAVASSYVDDPLAWNESSRRYVTEVPTFYVPGPNEWRMAPENSKQGSGDPVNEDLGESFTVDLMKHIDRSLHLYEEAMESGICAEQARLFLPAYGMYVRFRWTVSLASALHFINLRDHGEAQKEITEFARAVKTLTASKFPKSVEVFTDGD